MSADCRFMTVVAVAVHRCGAVVGGDGKVRPAVTGTLDERWRSAAGTCSGNDHHQQPTAVCLLMSRGGTTEREPFYHDKAGLVFCYMTIFHCNQG